MQVFTIVLIAFTVLSSFLAFSCSATGSDCINSKVAYTIKVSQIKGKAKFSRVQDAIDSIPSNNKQWIRVLVDPGTYFERVQIPYDKQCVVLQGHNAVDTVIAYNDHNNINTSNDESSATFTANADNFLARNIGFKNSYGSTAAGNWSRNIAIAVHGDKSAFYHCRFEGIQDTIFDASGRHYFKSCHIQGAVDFIWGTGQSVYEDCDIQTMFGGFITAQGRRGPDDPNGFVFLRGRIRGVGKSYLGRGYDTHSRVIFHQTFMHNVIQPAGWLAWHAIHHEQDVTYIEWDCRGPGANLSHRVPWMKKGISSGNEVNPYTVSNFITQDGWIARQPL